MRRRGLAGQEKLGEVSSEAWCAVGSGPGHLQEAVEGMGMGIVYIGFCEPGAARRVFSPRADREFINGSFAHRKTLR